MKKKSKPVARMGIGRFRAIMGAVLREGNPVILAKGGSPWSDPRAIVLIIPKFDRYSFPLVGFRKAAAKLRADLARAIDGIQPD